MPGMKPDDLYRLRSVSQCAMSPDGRLAAVTISWVDQDLDDYRSAIWVADTTTGESRQFTTGEKRDGHPQWSPDGQWLAFVSERGEEKPQIYVMRTDGGEATRITNLPMGAGAPVWSPDGTRIAFSAKTGEPPSSDPKARKPFRRITTMKYRMNGEGFTYDHRRHVFVVGADGSGEPQQLTEGDWHDDHPAWSPDGASIAFVSARHETRDSDNHSDLWVVGPEGGEARQVTDTSGACWAPAWSPDGSTIAHIHVPEWPSNPRPRVVGRDGGGAHYPDGAFDRATAGNGEQSSARPVWLQDGRLAGVADNRGTSAFIVTGEGATEWVGRADRVVLNYSFSADGSRVVFVASSATAPPEAFVRNMQTGEETRLTHAAEAFVASVELVDAEYFAVPTDEGTEVDCWVMRPAGMEDGKQYPVLLNVHGGPFGQYGFAFFDEFQVYTGAGYGVVFCNPRGSSGQSTAFGRSVVGRMGGPDYHDVMRAFEAALERMPWADRSRLGVMGGSYGGFMTSWIIGHDSRFRAAVSERAVNDWYTMQGTSDIGSSFNRNYLGENATIQQDLEAVLRQSPLTYAKNITTPVLILHAEDDLRCPISQAEQMWVVLKQMGKEAEFVRMPEGNHELSRTGRPSYRVERFEVVLEFFERKMAGSN